MSAKVKGRPPRPPLGEVSTTDAPIDAPLTQAERDWWEMESTGVFMKKLGWRMFSAGGFSALASLTRGYARGGDGFHLGEAVGTFLVTLALTAAVCAAMVRSEMTAARDEMIRRRRVQGAVAREESLGAGDGA